MKNILAVNFLLSLFNVSRSGAISPEHKTIVLKGKIKAFNSKEKKICF